MHSDSSNTGSVNATGEATGEASGVCATAVAIGEATIPSVNMNTRNLGIMRFERENMRILSVNEFFSANATPRILALR